MVKTIDFEYAAKNLKKLLIEVRSGVNQYILKDNGQEMAVLLSFNDFQRFSESKEQAKKRFFEMVDKIHQRTKDVPLKEIEDAVNEAVAAAKQEELKELETHI